MKTDQIQAAYARAIEAISLMTPEHVAALPLGECAFLLSAMPVVSQLQTVRAYLAKRLQTQLNTDWIERGNVCYVFSVLTALWRYEPTLITGQHLAAMAQRLIAAEFSVGGPYYFENSAILANVQIAIFMRTAVKPLPKVEAFLTNVIATGQLTKTGMCAISLVYLLSGAGVGEQLRYYVRRQQVRPQWQTPLGLATALLILKSSMTAPQITSVLQRLCSQQKDGLWQSGSSQEAHSALITTAVVTGVLAGFLPITTNNAASSLSARKRVIISAARQSFSDCSEPLRSLALNSVAKISAADKNFEITLLSWLFAQAMRTPDKLTAKQHTLLGSASLNGWIAYTIYDDFLDGKGQPAKLPLANIAMRASIVCFRLATSSQFGHNVNQIFLDMDTANAWELRYCRFAVTTTHITIGELPKYSSLTVLAARSFAHALGPLAVIACQKSTQRATRRIESAFKHYLIARQLNDDVHDWVQDTQAGQASYVVTAILRDMRIKRGTYSLASLLPAMQKNFRQTTLPKVCLRILHHTSRARQAFRKSELLLEQNNFYSLIDDLEQAATHAQDLHAKSSAFLAASELHEHREHKQ